MSETARMGLPLVQGGQAQKHVTVNEALQRIDALSQLVLASRSSASPPVSALPGETYAVPVGASGAWSGEEGRLAVYTNGGWDFVSPAAGWRAWIDDEGVDAVHDGSDWRAGAQAVSLGGAALELRVVEIDHAVDSGAQSLTAALIPAGSIVLGITGRVTIGLGGDALGFRIGIGGVSDDRYGSGIGTGSGAWFRGVTSSPQAYYSDTALTLTAEGGVFGSGGMVRVAAHLMQLGLPD